ncbi:heparinase II/III family protein [Bacillus salipaludis]|uniref:Heparinase II/III family protein n=1 Tax=Bacillus salipaludis TaxID=2547811 RepID=A0ABW8RQ34_9BACI
MDSKVKLYINTIKYLKPSQIYFRVFNRLKRELYKRKVLQVKIPSKVTISKDLNYIIPELDFDKDYLNRFDIDGILNGQFTFINLTNQVELSKAWNNKDLQHLWRYNLHYFEYLFKLSYEYSNGNKQNNMYYEKYRDLITNWIDNNPFAFGDGWHPYTISLRITNWIATYQVFKEKITNDNDFDKRFRVSLYLQYKYLQTNLEKDVLGNHYFENIKALIIGSVFFEETKVKNKYKNELMKQLKEQILEDGMHFELSPMYHKIILEDLIKITYWLKDETICNQLIPYISKMLDVTYSFEGNFGKTPAFNDSADGISKEYKSILVTCKRYFNLSPQFKSRFEDSGFYIIKDQYKKLIFDVGEISPSYLPAHGHCDALSFELSINSKPMLVNSGTYRYEAGKWRDYFRSTKAHNTVMISDQEQSQFWGGFRVAKRIKKVRKKQFVYKNISFYAGDYISHTGDKHKRFIGHIDENNILVLDYLNTELKDKIKSYLHFVPGTHLEVQENTIYANQGSESIKITAIGTSEINFEKGWHSNQFNVKEEINFITLKKDDKKALFGYLINFNVSSYKILTSENELKIINDKEVIINYQELGDML